MALSLLVAALVVACADGEDTAGDGPTVTPTPTSGSEPGASATTALRQGAGGRTPPNPSLARGGATASRFGLQVLDELVADTAPGNLAVAPAALAQALAMVRAGASGETAAELDSALGTAAGQAGPILNAVSAALQARSGERQRSFGSTGTVTVNSAASLWVPADAEPDRATLDALAAAFGSGVIAAPLVADPTGSRALMAAWLTGEGRPEGSEPENPESEGLEVEATDLPGGDDPLRLVALAATAVTAPWDRPFDLAATTTGLFTTGDGSTVSVDMMTQQQQFPAAAGDTWRAVELPLVGRELGLVVIVPTAGTSPPSTDVVPAVLAALAPRPARVAVPHFAVTGPPDVTAAAAAAGLSSTTDGASTGLAAFGVGPAHGVGLLAQAVSLRVDEAGVGGAAPAPALADPVTGGPPPLDVVADRPFLVVLRDLVTGTILVAGTVVTPAG